MYGLGVVSWEHAERRVAAADRHDRAAERYEASAARWIQRGDSEIAELEMRHADHERAAAKLERDHAALIRRRLDQR